MKLFLGIISTIVVLTGAALAIVSMWEIYPISWQVVLKFGLTVAIACLVFLLLWLIKTIFFSKNLFSNKK